MTTQHALVHLAPDPGHTARELVDRAEDALWDLPGGWENVLITKGRYAEYFPLRSGADADDPRLIRAPECETSRYAGGPIGLLDLDARRVQEAVKAARLYDAWTQAVSAMPPVRSLTEYTDGHGQSVKAQLAFKEQPQIKILTTMADYRLSRGDQEALASLDREAFVERARLQAVTGDSLLQLDGTWLTNPACKGSLVPDSIGTDYHQYVNTYLDNLPADHLLIGADFIR